MTRLQKIWTIATFEFLTAVKRPGYLIATFGMPLFVAAYAAVVAVPAYFASRADDAAAVYGVVDETGLLGMRGESEVKPATPVPEELRRALEATGQEAAVGRVMAGSERFVYRPYPTEPAARAALAARTIKGYFRVPADYVEKGVVEIYAPDTFNMSGSESRTEFSRLLRRQLLAGRIDGPMAERVVSPLGETRRYGVTRAGELTDGSTSASLVRLAVPLTFMVLFLMSVLMTSGYLMQGTATEKENKVVEVLLASANPDEILAGKLVGLGGAGLLQIGVWLVIALGTGIGAVPLLMSARVEIPWLALALAIPLFLVAFLFFGSLMLGTGSLGSNMREAQQLAMVWSLTAALPMMMMSALVREPQGTIARVLTWVPFTSGPILVMRASMDASAVAWWEIAGGFATLVLCTWFALRLGGRLFRLGLLSSSRPSLKEIVRQARLA
jgi:ABC-2 type transport system permease protein